MESYKRDNILVQMRATVGANITEPPALSGSTLYLTELEDHSDPRPGTDELYLSASGDQSPVERPPVVTYYTEYEYTPDLHKWPFWLFGLTGIVLGGRGIARRLRAA